MNDKLAKDIERLKAGFKTNEDSIAKYMLTYYTPNEFVDMLAHYEKMKDSENDIAVHVMYSLVVYALQKLFIICACLDEGLAAYLTEHPETLKKN